MKKTSIIILLLCLVLFFGNNSKATAQVPEVGFSFILSGAIMFGPHFGYWIDNHQCLEASVLAAWEKQIIFPFALNGGYSYYLGNKSWQPKLGLQYSLLISPIHHKSENDPRSVSLISLVPGFQYRSNDFHQTAKGQIWVAFFLKEKKVAPIALEGIYGYKF